MKREEGNLQRTPLWPEQQREGAKFFAFAGWHMPMEYQQSWREEHLMVREKVGLFDVSHMGEIRVKGKGSSALKALQYVTSNDVSRLTKGRAQYSLFLNDKGGIVDDLIVYCFKEGEDYLLCVNAANRKKDFQWLLSHCQDPNTTIEDESDFWAQLAVQGPLSFKLLEGMFPGLETRLSRPFSWGTVTWQEGRLGRLEPLEGLGNLGNSKGLENETLHMHIARTGYTGEKGVEIFVPQKGACALWRSLQARAKKEGLDLKPIGLVARDSLRLEMKYPLYGQDIDEEYNPFQAGLSWVVKMDKGSFMGRESFASQDEKQLLGRVLVGFRLLERGGIPRKGLFPFLLGR